VERVGGGLVWWGFLEAQTDVSSLLKEEKYCPHHLREGKTRRAIGFDEERGTAGRG